MSEEARVPEVGDRVRFITEAWYIGGDGGRAPVGSEVTVTFAAASMGTVRVRRDDGVSSEGSLAWLAEVTEFVRSASTPKERGEARFPPQAGDVWRHSANDKEYTFTGESLRQSQVSNLYPVKGGGGFHSDGGAFEDARLTFVRRGPTAAPASPPVVEASPVKPAPARHHNHAYLTLLSKLEAAEGVTRKPHPERCTTPRCPTCRPEAPPFVPGVTDEDCLGRDV